MSYWWDMLSNKTDYSMYLEESKNYESLAMRNKNQTTIVYLSKYPETLNSHHCSCTIQV